MFYFNSEADFKLVSCIKYEFRRAVCFIKTTVFQSLYDIKIERTEKSARMSVILQLHHWSSQ